MPPGTLSEETLAPIRAAFFLECEDLLGELEAGLLSLQDGGGDAATIDSVFRAVHSIKGSAGAFDCANLVRFSHTFESVLAAVRAGALAVDPPLVSSLLRASDVLADLVRAARDKADDTAILAAAQPLVEALEQACPPREKAQPFDDGFWDFPPSMDAGPDPDVLAASWRIRFRPSAGFYATANEPLLVLRDLGRLGALSVHLDAGAIPPIDDFNPDEAYLCWTVVLVTEARENAIRDVFEFVEDLCDLTIERIDSPSSVAREPAERDAGQTARRDVGAALPAPGPTIRVDLDRVDRLINLVGELVINQAMLVQRVADAGLATAPGMELPLDELDQLTRDLQDSVMAMRAQPVKLVFQRMARLVRETAAETGKQVRLTMSGEDTQVDRTVIERLTDPLTHMIRNAIDHGIETPQARAAAGKSPEGLLHISAAHRGGRIHVAITDDGAGIDRVAVRRTAVRRGLIASEAALSDEELDNLIFAPGFSTASELSATSGRGVGMDVVKRGVQQLGGRITTVSRLGVGTSFTLSLPLTLAVMDGMVASVGGHSVVAPLTSLIESVRPSPEDIRALGPDTSLLFFRGARLPLIDLAAVLGYGRARDSAATVALIVEDDLGLRAALLVDELLGQRQVVIKSLEANCRAVPGIAAATILADGRVALILDVGGLLKTCRTTSGAVPSAATG